MSTRLAALSLAIAAATLAACAGGGSPTGASGANTVLLPSYNKNVAVFATLPKDTIGEELPSEGLGSINDSHWKAIARRVHPDEFLASAWLSDRHEDHAREPF